MSSPALSCTGSRPKRVVTEARKLQNREAQRAYRQRQKEQKKVQNQHRKRASVRYQPLRPLPFVPDRAGTDPVGHDPELDMVHQHLDGPDIGGLDPLSAVSTRAYFENECEIEDMNPSDLGTGVDALFPPSLATNIDSELDELLASAPDNEVHLLLSTELDKAEEIPSNWSLLPIRSNPYPSPSVTLPTHLEPSRTSLLTACMHNASTIGISIDEFFTYNCLSLCSPFYRSTSPSTDPKSLLHSINMEKPSIPAHLQPTIPQIMIPHHPIFDLIPIPVLRTRAIILSATTPHLVNMFELKVDIIEGGLVCSGSRGGGSGQPWDLRSWEVLPWFRRKWRLLLEREGGDFWGG
ncbi:hypothetical protein BDW59DRAFT_171220 [Aspergillus cavernicola]|uniref:BZIP domain-containing protein n=1 Tax=Aspergillus cavernicola TaxID=176166 RepID=A0ABR4IJ31_9EURO